jgi:class 3 adenylate cyclase
MIWFATHRNMLTMLNFSRASQPKSAGTAVAGDTVTRSGLPPDIGYRVGMRAISDGVAEYALATERVERRLAAILPADMAGYSWLMGADEEATLARLKAHRNEGAG